MRAALYRETGDPSVLRVEEVDTPEPGPGRIRVRVTRSGVNPTDWKTRSGATPRPLTGLQVPHQDGAGVVDALGPGVEGPEVGRRVWLHLAAFDNPWGTAAEYCVVPAERVVELPDGASDDLGASLGVPALTAAHCLGDRHALRGRTVLVAGGAGAVGHAAIELARHAGATVATTVSGEAKAALARAAGADLVVNYREDGASDVLRSLTDHYDRIVELALGANLDLDLAVAGPETVVSVYAAEAEDPVLPARRLMGANLTVRWMLLYNLLPADLAAAVDWTRDALLDGALSPLPVQVYGLEETVEAQRAVEAGGVGKVLVDPWG